VDDSQLSLAIGKKGQNVRLAAKLLGWKIDIKSEEEKRQEVEQEMSRLVTTATPLTAVAGLGEGLTEKLAAAGVTTVEALADMTPEQLEAIEGIGPKTVEKISIAVSDYFASLEAAAAAAEAAQQAASEAVAGKADASGPVAAGTEGSLAQATSAEPSAAEAEAVQAPAAEPVNAEAEQPAAGSEPTA